MVGDDVPVPQPVVAAADRELEALLADLEGALEAHAVAEHALRQVDADRDQQAGCRQRHQQQDQFRQAGGVTELAREPVLQRGEQSVELQDPVGDRAQGRIGSVARHGRVQLLGRMPHLLDELVALGPGLDHFGDGRNVLEAAEQAHHVGNVIRVGASLGEPVEGDRVVVVALFASPRAPGGRPG